VVGEEQVKLEVTQLHGAYMLAEMALAAIRTAKLSKDYGLGRGLFDLDLQVSPQEVFGYLGPNGAGKTTTIRLLMGMIRPSGGSAHIFGLECQRDAVQVKRKVGYLPGDIPQFGSLRGSEVVAYLGGMRGGVEPKSVRNIAERFDLDLSRRFREYSSGNKQKLGILLAFMHKPELLILDEPTGGLDPLNQREFYKLLHETRERGATVFLSSHILSEVEHVCDRVGIVRAGRLVKVADIADRVSTDPSLEEMFLSYYGEKSSEALPP
jgi:ABC-2 type transport system ATP-binding protein